jgi:hypothetical protein
MAKKQPKVEEAGEPAPAAAGRRVVPWRPLTMAAIMVAFIAGAVMLWRNFGDAITQRGGSQYLLEVKGIELSPAPPWLKADVRAEVYADSGWDKEPPSILQPDLTIRVAQAFEQHTWVAKVTRVTKHHPARVAIELTYRRPAAMVEVDYQGQSGLLPVDTEGVLLPPDDFNVEEAGKYPRIAVDYTGPSGSVGTPWGDPRVEGAARIAGQLADVWRECKLHRIVVETTPQATSAAVPMFALVTRGKSRVLWGHAPGHEVAQEASAQQKLSRLRQHIQQHGALDSGATPITLDVRDAERVSSRPSTPQS